MRAGGSDVENARRREEILTRLAFSTAVLTCVPPHLCTASPRPPVRHHFVHSENGAVRPACMYVCAPHCMYTDRCCPFVLAYLARVFATCEVVATNDIATNDIATNASCLVGTAVRAAVSCGLPPCGHVPRCGHSSMCRRVRCGVSTAGYLLRVLERGCNATSLASTAHGLVSACLASTTHALVSVGWACRSAPCWCTSLECAMMRCTMSHALHVA